MKTLQNTPIEIFAKLPAKQIVRGLSHFEKIFILFMSMPKAKQISMLKKAGVK